MKTRKWLAVVLAVVMCMMLAACDDDHTHTYAEDWSSDATSHWHVATCDDTDEVSGLAKHTFGDWAKGDVPACTLDADNTRACTECGYTETVQPVAHELSKTDATVKTCETDGVNEYWQCGICNKYFSDENAENEIAAPVVNEEKGHVLVPLTAKQANCGEEGFAAHYECSECGKTFADAAGTEEIKLEMIPMDDSVHGDIIEATQTKSFSKNFVFTSQTYYECEVCHKPFADAAGTKPLTDKLVYTGSTRIGILMEESNFTVEKSKASQVVTFRAPTSNTYVFTFSGAGYTKITMIAYNSGETMQSVYSGAKWSTTTVYHAKFQDKENSPANNTVTVEMKENDAIVFTISATANKAVNIKQTIDATAIRAGENTITVAEASAVDVNLYTFMPTETKTYSLTVPAGVSVLMDGDNFITAGDGESTEEKYANFEATEGVPVTFDFVADTTGEYTVTIGDEKVIPIYLTEGQTITVDMFSRKACKVILNDIEDGTYTISIAGVFVTGRATGYGSMVCQINEEITNFTANYLSGGQASVNLGNGVTANCKTVPWTITTTFTAGDAIYFAPYDAWNIPEGNALGNIEVTLTKVTA